MLCSSRMMWCGALAALVSLVSAGSLSAQQPRRPGGTPGGPGGPGGRGGFQFGGFGGGGGLGLLQRTDVQEELELLDDQKKQLTDLREKMGQKMRDLFANARGNEGGGQDQMRESFRKLTEENQAAVNEILLPHQNKRLKQLEVQMSMRGRGVLGGLGGGSVAEQLGIDEAQQEKLREKAQELDNELRKKTAEIRKTLQDQLLASLTADQRQKFKDLIGEPFEFRDEPGEGPGGGFGGPGGPGGRRGERPRNDQ